MLFLWDSKKAEKNVRKHNVSFEVAQSVFDSALHLSVPDKRVHEEERWITIGKTPHGKTLVVVHTYFETEDGQEMIRIISARGATRREARQYEEGI